MMALAAPDVARLRAPEPLMGSQEPRIAPPLPLADISALEETAAGIGITLMPWQCNASRYLVARKPDGSRLYREVCILVARQNGKTELLKPLIIWTLRNGGRVMHIAHDRNLPRIMFDVIATALSDEPELFPKRRGKTIWPRYGAGQEEIKLVNGGTYRIAASRTGGARGSSNDLVIIDELREMESHDVIDAAEPTLLMSPDPLMVYLSNAGTDKSVVLKSVQERAGEDPNLAYLEWSAEPGMDAGDRKGWAQANPSLGHQPQVLPALEAAYTRHRLAGTMPTFETENLCRHAASLLPPVVSQEAWDRARGTLPSRKPARAAMGIKVDPEGRRASAVIAWKDGDDVCVRSFAEDTTSPLDLEAFAAALLPHMRQHRVRDTAFDPWTDHELARLLPRATKVNGQLYQAASRDFARMVESRQLRHDDDGTIADDLAYTVRKETVNGWYAVRAGPERATTAGEAAIRAAWLASAPRRRAAVH